MSTPGSEVTATTPIELVEEVYGRLPERVALGRDAALLEVPVGSPVLRCERTTSDPAGRPVLLSEHVFPAHRTEFVVDLPSAEPSIAPSGLRLLE